MGARRTVLRRADGRALGPPRHLVRISFWCHGSSARRGVKGAWCGAAQACLPARRSESGPQICPVCFAYSASSDKDLRRHTLSCFESMARAQQAEASAEVGQRRGALRTALSRPCLFAVLAVLFATVLGFIRRASHVVKGSDAVAVATLR